MTLVTKFITMLRVAILVAIVKIMSCIDEEVHQKYLTLPRVEFIEYFNSQNFSWKITDNNQTFHLGAQKLIGDRYPTECNLHMEDLPNNFDAREKWPQCETIKEVNDQGDCESCWTFGTGNTASDRTCIHKGIHVHLSEQDFQCLESEVCEGGDPDKAFDYWRDHGLVSNKCKPYDIPKLKNGECESKCVNQSISYNDDKHYAEKVYKITNDVNCIKSELFKNGPVQAAFAVYADFKDYNGGVYVHTYGDIKGRHSVRVIGYGVEDDIEYWLAVNTQGGGWGEKGLFKFKINQDLGFENDVLTGIPKN